MTVVAPLKQKVRQEVCGPVTFRLSSVAEAGGQLKLALSPRQRPLTSRDE